jgi:hypothetical protein
MSSPKLKAQAIFNKMLFCYQGHIDEYTAKQCALVAVDEIIEAIDFDWMEVQNLDSEHRYWEKVRQEIEKL